MTPDPGATVVAARALLRGGSETAPHLLVVGGPDAGRRIPLAPDQTLGRGLEADRRLADGTASRLHLRLALVDGRYVATDLGSKNGLRINGRRCRAPRSLRPGDELAVGATVMTLQLIEQPPGDPEREGSSPPDRESALEGSVLASEAEPEPARLASATSAALIAGAVALTAAAALIAWR
jgi:S-DNA-T family DNA segregation ATPase FtsK/SpoIIIE